MKNILFVISMLCCSSMFAQFEYNKNGLTDYVVVELDGYKSEVLYQKSINWIKDNYRNPDEVIKTSIENKKIRFEGFIQLNNPLLKVDNPESYNNGSLNYTIEVDIKEGKYRFNPTELYYIPEPEYVAQYGLSEIDMGLHDSSKYYDKEGSLVAGVDVSIKRMEDLFNFLSSDLKKYITATNDDW